MMIPRKKEKIAFIISIVLLLSVREKIHAQKIQVFSDENPAYFFSSPERVCKAPCLLDLEGRSEFFFLHDQTPSDVSDSTVSSFDLGIVHTDSQLVKFDILDISRRILDNRELRYSCVGNCKFGPKFDNTRMKESPLWTAGSRSVKLTISRNRDCLLLQTETYSETNPDFTPQEKIFVANLKTVTKDVLFEEGSFRPIVPLAGYKASVYSISNNSEWALIRYERSIRNMSVYPYIFFRIINTQTPSRFFEIENSGNTISCHWSDKGSGLYCTHPGKKNISVYIIHHNKLLNYIYDSADFLIRSPICLRWVADYLFPFDFRNNFDLYDPANRKLVHHLQGKSILFYSSSDDLLITFETLPSEKIGERKLRLFFYNKFTLVGEKLFVSHNKIRTNFGDSDVPNLFSAFNFLLTQKSYTIYEDDVLAQLGIDFDPNREYRWTGDFIQVSSNRKNIESEPYLETIGRLKVFLPNFSPDNIILNSISDYYFFPKPEVQE